MTTARVPDHQDPCSVTVMADGKHYQVTLRPGMTFRADDDVVQQHPWAFQLIQVVDGGVEDATANPGRKRSVRRTASIDDD